MYCSANVPLKINECFLVADPIQFGYNLFSCIPGPAASALSCIPGLAASKLDSTRPTIKSEPEDTVFPLVNQVTLASVCSVKNVVTFNSKGGFLFEDSDALLPVVFVHRRTSKRFMILEDVLNFLQLRSLRELAIKIDSTFKGAGVESRTELSSNFSNKYEWLPLGTHHFSTRALRRRRVKLVHYTGPMRHLLGVSEVVIR